MTRVRIFSLACALCLGIGTAAAQTAGGGGGAAGAGGGASGVGGAGGAAGMGTTGTTGTSGPTAPSTGVPAPAAGGTAGTSTGVTTPGAAVPENGINASGVGSAVHGTPTVKNGGTTGAGAAAPGGRSINTPKVMSAQPGRASGAGLATGGSGTYGRKSSVNPDLKLNPDQRRQVVRAVDQMHVRALAHPGFDVAPGLAVPGRVGLYKLPSGAASAIPAWRGFSFFRTTHEIVIVDPMTRVIVQSVRG